ncbi:hypothetical protein P7H53_10880 [Enterococcus thailandicus]|nr:hypothetical protein [Enterococcus thailandicus]
MTQPNKPAADMAYIDISGTFYTTSGDTARVKLLSKNKWEIFYSTLEGEVNATFETNWEISGQEKQSKTPMEKSDEYSGFHVLVTYVNESDIEIIMEDGDPTHKMVFTKQKPKENENYEIVLQGDLSPFAGQFSSDYFNKKIVDSGFTLGGYAPDDYYNNRTTVFPTLSANGYWDGITSHGNYEIKASDMPQKTNGYFEVRVHGTNPVTNYGELAFFLVPPNVSGPDGTLSKDRRVFQVLFDGKLRLLEYQKEDWWKEYQSQ